MPINSDSHKTLFNTLTQLGDMPVERFLTEYWQKKPLLIRQAIPNFQSPISADELAGFSLDEDICSRLVIEDRATNNWQVKHGPLNESDFAKLPDTDWSLLVQNVDALDLSVNALLSLFRFLPNWRLDDIMVSYSPIGGGVGPHFDYYDVFLLQGEGERRWRLGQHCDSSSDLLEDQPMNILSEFHGETEWLTKPGDIIYIPAHIAHWGESLSPSITYSFGFRAPSHADLLLDLAQEVASTLTEDQRYRDSALSPKPVHDGGPDSARIDATVISEFQSTLEALVSDPQMIGNWLGEYSTRLKNESLLPELDFAEQDDWLNNQPLQLSSFCRSAYITSSTSEENTRLFINGESYECTAALASLLSNYKTFTREQLAAGTTTGILDATLEQQLMLDLIDTHELIVKA